MLTMQVTLMIDKPQVDLYFSRAVGQKRNQNF